MTGAAVAGVVIVGLGAGADAVVATREAPEYRAVVAVVVTDNPPTAPGIHYLPYLGPGVDVVRTLALLVTAPGVIDPVAAASSEKISSARLGREVSVAAPAQGRLIAIRVTDRHAQQAATYADAVADQFASYVVTLNPDPASGSASIGVTRAGGAATPTQALARPWRRDVGIGALVGAGITLLVGLSHLARHRARARTS